MKKQSEKLISVITVCLNAADYIEKTLQSVSEQSCHLFEYLVIDGKSTDTTLEIVGRYRNHIDCLISERDGGIYAAMNKAVKKARGQWIIFLNAGDVFCGPLTLDEMAVCLQKTSASLVYGDIMKKDKQGQLVKKSGRSASQCSPDVFLPSGTLLQDFFVAPFPF
jgi:Glycosyltransferases involved in cell wall biogenesis